MNIILILKGIIIGIGKIIPGVSGSIMAISLNVYDKAIDSITNFFNNPKKNIKFILNLGLGILLGIILFSKIINYFLTNYYLYTTIIFIGLIIGGIKEIIKNSNNSIKGILLTIISFIIMTLLSLLNTNNNYTSRNNIVDLIVYLISGILEGIGTIIPGISSTALLMMMGIYKYFINSLSNITNLNYIITNIKFLAFFTIGFLISTIISILIINILFKKHKKLTFNIILGILISNILFLLLNIISYINISNILLSLILLTLGIIISLII